MAKMMKPEVKAVRFCGADVIATSALRYGGYLTKRDEAIQAGLVSSDSSTQTWIAFNYTKNDGIVYFNSYDDPAKQAVIGNSPYAWYNSNNQWVTDGVAWKDYTNGDYPVD